MDVTLALGGDPLLATGASMAMAVVAEGGADLARLIERAKATSTVSNSIARGVPVTVSVRPA